MGNCDAPLQVKVVQSPSLEIFKRCADMVLEEMVYCGLQVYCGLGIAGLTFALDDLKALF